MNNTPIEWTDFTVNPFRFRNIETGKVGHYCEKISPGCKNCYAGKMQRGPYLSGLDYLAENKAKGEVFLDQNVVEQVRRRKKHCRIFWCDMTDMFLADYPDAWIMHCIEAMWATPHIIHQVLTKRSGRLCALLGSMAIKGHPITQNIHFGISVEDQERANERKDDLRSVANLGWNTFVSYEPAIGPVNWLGWEFLKWGIVGGESGPQAREFNIAWAREAVDQWSAMGVSPFVKQLGSSPMIEAERTVLQPGIDTVKLVHLELIHKKGGNMSEWPSDLRVREFPG